MYKKATVALLIILTGFSIVHASIRLENLPGWWQESPTQAWSVLQTNCQFITKHRSVRVPAAWRQFCHRLIRTKLTDNQQIRRFLNQQMVAYQRSETGHFTGYFAPVLAIRHHLGGRYTAPLYAMPYHTVIPSRKAINRGALAGQAEILGYADPVDRFFLQIQGSGIAEYRDGQRVQLRFAGKNGFPYTAIGQVLIKRGVMTKQEVSMQSLKRWLRQHPLQAREIMETNQSFIFFQRINQTAIKGAMGIPLTPTRSLAVDRRFVDLGLALWVDTRFPITARQSTATRPLQRLMVAQDAGSAILGEVRGDVYWGIGQRAAAIAGPMNELGRWWLLWPRGEQPPPGWY